MRRKTGKRENEKTRKREADNDFVCLDRGLARIIRMTHIRSALSASIFVGLREY